MDASNRTRSNHPAKVAVITDLDLGGGEILAILSGGDSNSRSSAARHRRSPVASAVPALSNDSVLF